MSSAASKAERRKLLWQEKALGIMATVGLGLLVYVASTVTSLKQAQLLQDASISSLDSRVTMLERWGPQSGDRVTRQMYDEFVAGVNARQQTATLALRTAIDSLASEMRGSQRDLQRELALVGQAMAPIRETVARIEEKTVSLNERVQRIESRP